MSRHIVHMVGHGQAMLVENDTATLSDLARDVSCGRFLLGRLVAVDGAAVAPRAIMIAVGRIATITEPVDDEC